MSREAVIVAVSRTAVGRAEKGLTRNVRPEDMAVAVIQNLLGRVEGKLDPARVDDLVLGCAYPEGAQGLNVARPIGLRARLPVDVPAQTINRFCSSGLQSIAIGAERIIANGADIVIAGGVESMSAVPMIGYHLSLDPWIVENNPEVYMSMGLTAERVAEEFSITREDQDEFSYHSHRKAAEAVDSGKFDDEIVPIEFDEVWVEADGTRLREPQVFMTDEHLRRETSLEGLAGLRPVFKKNGTVTAGNSSPLSDGAAAVLMMEADTAVELGIEPMARFVGFSAAGVRPEIMGVGPVRAVPRVLERTGIQLGDIELIELNEDFASQSVAVMRELEFDPRSC